MKYKYYVKRHNRPYGSNISVYKVSKDLKVSYWSHMDLVWKIAGNAVEDYTDTLGAGTAGLYIRLLGLPL